MSNLTNLYIGNTRGELQRRIDRMRHDLANCTDDAEACELVDAIEHLGRCLEHGCE